VGNLRKILNAKATLADGLAIPAGSLRARPHFVEHHLAHIASSYYVSPFERAAVLSIDGFGDMISAMWGIGNGGRLKILGEVAFPHSLGVYYTAVPSSSAKIWRRVQSDGPSVLRRPNVPGRVPHDAAGSCSLNLPPFAITWMAPP
jgi:hypothetical protein